MNRTEDDLDQRFHVEQFAISDSILLRRMVIHSREPKGTVILLHGFPETIFAWGAIARALANEYDVHTFDWPGFGLSTRPSAEAFPYSPRIYASSLKQYIGKAGIDRSNLTIYATDISSLPVLLLALEEPDIARSIIVGDFAPFDRPAYMNENLQRLKSKPSSDFVRAAMNNAPENILEEAFTNGLPENAKFTIDPEFKDDMRSGWNHGVMTTMDAFYHYYSHFTRDQNYFEENIGRLKTPVKVIWGELDFYIMKEMGIELADRIGAKFQLLPGIGHYPHLQAPEQAMEEIRASFCRQ